MYEYLNQAECELYCSHITSYSTLKKVGKYKTNLPFTKTAQKKTLLFGYDFWCRTGTWTYFQKIVSF